MKPSFYAPSSAKILQIVYDYELACCTNVAARLNIAELLYESPKSIAELAVATRANGPALYRVLRVLAGAGIFKETANQVFVFTESATALHAGVEGSIKYYLEAILGEHSHAFGNMLHSVMTGETAFDHYYKMDVWAWYGQHGEVAANFNKAMAGLTQYYARTAIPAYPFNDFESIVDIGGGNGALLFAILAATQKPKGIIFDAPFVIPQSEQLIEEQQLQERCNAVAGNFFESVPPGKDLYLLKYILHDWADEDCIRILRNCADAMKTGSKVLILEAVIPAGNGYHVGKYTDVTMLVATRGRERSEEDFKRLLTEAGLRFNKIIPLSLDEISLIEGEKG
jgi:O-methyltransferase domain